MTTEQIQQELEEVNRELVNLLFDDQTVFSQQERFHELCDRQKFLNNLLCTSKTQQTLDEFIEKQLNAEACLFVGVAALIIGLILSFANIWL